MVLHRPAELARITGHVAFMANIPCQAGCPDRRIRKWDPSSNSHPLSSLALPPMAALAFSFFTPPGPARFVFSGSTQFLNFLSGRVAQASYAGTILGAPFMRSMSGLFLF
jgi:hypothetical protein